MSGKEILVDTNIIIYLLQGDDTLETLLQGKQLHLSFITELELFGLQGLSAKQEKQIETLLDECQVIPLNNHIKQHYRNLRKKFKLKLADAVVAATAFSLELPLMTADKQFSVVKGLSLLSYEK
jgi:predicted nucleic acid-binding protein